MGRPLSCNCRCSNCDERIYIWPARIYPEQVNPTEGVTQLGTEYFIDEPLGKSFFYFSISDVVPEPFLNQGNEYRITYYLNSGSHDGETKFKFIIEYNSEETSIYNRSSTTPAKRRSKITIWTPEEEYFVWGRIEDGVLENAEGPVDDFLFIFRDNYISIFHNFKNLYNFIRNGNRTGSSVKNSSFAFSENRPKNDLILEPFYSSINGYEELDTTQILFINKVEILEELFLSIKLERLNGSNVNFPISDSPNLEEWMVITGNIPDTINNRNLSCFDEKDCIHTSSNFKTPKWDINTDLNLSILDNDLNYTLYLNKGSYNPCANFFVWNNYPKEDDVPIIIPSPAIRFTVGNIDGYQVYRASLDDSYPISQYPSGSIRNRNFLGSVYCRIVDSDDDYYYIEASSSYNFIALNRIINGGRDIDLSQINTYTDENIIEIIGPFIPTNGFDSSYNPEPSITSYLHQDGVPDKDYLFYGININSRWIKRIPKWNTVPPEINFNSIDDDVESVEISTYSPFGGNIDLYTKSKIEEKIPFMNIFNKMNYYKFTNDIETFVGDDPLFFINWYYYPFYLRYVYEVGVDSLSISDIDFTLTPSLNGMPHPNV